VTLLFGQIVFTLIPGLAPASWPDFKALRGLLERLCRLECDRLVLLLRLLRLEWLLVWLLGLLCGLDLLEVRLGACDVSSTPREVSVGAPTSCCPAHVRRHALLGGLHGFQLAEYSCCVGLGLCGRLGAAGSCRRRLGVVVCHLGHCSALLSSGGKVLPPTARTLGYLSRRASQLPWWHAGLGIPRT
jgi:hypothetical protein